MDCVASRVQQGTRNDVHEHSITSSEDTQIQHFKLRCVFYAFFISSVKDSVSTKWTAGLEKHMFHYVTYTIPSLSIPLITLSTSFFSR